MTTEWYSFADENSSVDDVQIVAGGAENTANGAMVSYTGIGGVGTCDEWQPNTNYPVGTSVTYNGNIYTSVNDWNGSAGSPDQATWGWEPGGDCGSDEIFAGMGFDLRSNGSSYDLTGSSGISFYHKGPSCQLEIKQTAVTDYAYYSAPIPAHSSWTKVDLEWQDFAQPSDWGETVAWDPSDIQGFQWKRVATEGEVDEFQIDEVKILGLEFSTVYTSILNQNEKKEMDILIYPNPVNDWLNIKKLNGNYSLGALYGMDGRFYTSFNLINQSQYCVSLKGVKEGKYLLILNGNSGVTKSFVIVKAESGGF